MEPNRGEAAACGLLPSLSFFRLSGRREAMGSRGLRAAALLQFEVSIEGLISNRQPRGR